MGNGVGVIGHLGTPSIMLQLQQLGNNLSLFQSIFRTHVPPFLGERWVGLLG